MYSVVLMMALSGGAETPDFGHRSSCSCSGGCYGGCYGCYSGCSGRGHGHSRRGHGCHGCYGGCYSSCYGGCYGGGYGGCYGGYGCSGGYVCSGCYGGGYGCSGGCYGGGYGGCYGGGYGGCWGGCYGGGYGGVVTGGAVVNPAQGGAQPPANGDNKGAEKINPPAKSALPAPAVILVNLPSEAKLLVDGTVTTSTSAQRRLVSPALQQGREYHYTLTAEVVRNGQTVRESRPVTVRAGQETNVQFTFADPAVTASR